MYRQYSEPSPSKQQDFLNQSSYSFLQGSDKSQIVFGIDISMIDGIGFADQNDDLNQDLEGLLSCQTPRSQYESILQQAKQLKQDVLELLEEYAVRMQESDKVEIRKKIILDHNMVQYRLEQIKKCMRQYDNKQYSDEIDIIIGVVMDFLDKFQNLVQLSKHRASECKIKQQDKNLQETNDSNSNSNNSNGMKKSNNSNSFEFEALSVSQQMNMLKALNEKIETLSNEIDVQNLYLSQFKQRAQQVILYDQNYQGLLNGFQQMRLLEKIIQNPYLKIVKKITKATYLKLSIIKEQIKQDQYQDQIKLV